MMRKIALVMLYTSKNHEHVPLTIFTLFCFCLQFRILNEMVDFIAALLRGAKMTWGKENWAIESLLTMKNSGVYMK